MDFELSAERRPPVVQAWAAYSKAFGRRDVRGERMWEGISEIKRHLIARNLLRYEHRRSAQ